MFGLLYTLLVSANIALAIINAKICARNNDPFVTFWIAITIIFFVPSYGDYLGGYIEATPRSQVFLLDPHNAVAAQLIALTSMLLMTGLTLAFKSDKLEFRVLDKRRTLLTNHPAFALLMVVLVIGVVLATMEAYRKFGAGLIGDFAWSERRQLSRLASLQLHIGAIIFSGLGFVAWVSGRRLLFGAVFVILTGLYFVLGGTRQPILALAVAVFAYWLCSNNRPTRTIVLVCLLSPVLIYAVEVLVYLRYLRGVQERFDALAAPLELWRTVKELPGGTEADLRFAFYYLLTDGSGIAGLYEANYIRRILFFLIPEGVGLNWLRGENIEQIIAFNYYPGREGNMHATAFGVFYADLGTFYMAWAALLYFIMRAVKEFILRLRGVQRAVMWSVAAFSGMMFARGAIYVPIILLGVAAILLLFTHLIDGNRGLRRWIGHKA